MSRIENPETISIANSMILSAKSLQHVTKELDGQNKLGSSQSDPLLFHGTFVAIPVLLSFAVEIALKALLYLESKAGPHLTHDLLELYKKLSESSKKLIKEKIPPHKLLSMASEWDTNIRESLMLSRANPSGSNYESELDKALKSTLCFHRKAFVDWRYLHEGSHGQQFFDPALHIVLTAVIGTCDKKLGEFAQSESW